MHISYITAKKGIAAAPFVAHYGEPGEMSNWEPIQRVWQAALIIFKFNSLRISFAPACRLAHFSMPETVKKFFGNMTIMEDDILELLLAYTFWNHPTPITSGYAPI